MRMASVPIIVSTVYDAFGTAVVCVLPDKILKSFEQAFCISNEHSYMRNTQTGTPWVDSVLKLLRIVLPWF